MLWDNIGVEWKPAGRSHAKKNVIFANLTIMRNKLGVLPSYGNETQSSRPDKTKFRKKRVGLPVFDLVYEVHVEEKKLGIRGPWEKVFEWSSKPV